MEPSKATSVNSRAEELFVQLFCEAFGPEKTENLQVQYPCVDIYGWHRYISEVREWQEDCDFLRKCRSCGGDCEVAARQWGEGRGCFRA